MAQSTEIGSILLRKGFEKMPAVERFSFGEEIVPLQMFDDSLILDVRKWVAERFNGVIEEQIPPCNLPWHTLTRETTILDVVLALCGDVGKYKEATSSLAHLMRLLAYVPQGMGASPTTKMGFISIDHELWVLESVMHDGGAIISGGVVASFKSGLVAYNTTRTRRECCEGDIIFGGKAD